MNHGGRILDAIADLTALFAQHCADRETLDALHALVPEKGKWGSARGVLDRAQKKHQRAYAAKDDVGLAQYDFEAACAKTLVNLSYPSAPFDADSPYWIVPKALVLAQRVGIAETEVTRRVAV
jgi:hypothetical protein